MNARAVLIASKELVVVEVHCADVVVASLSVWYSEDNSFAQSTVDNIVNCVRSITEQTTAV